MKNKRTLVIIGGGISGCVAAFLAVKKNYDVHLIEKDDKLGGVLKDVSQNDDNYFRACQYINPEARWYKEIPFKELDLQEFLHEKGTYTDIFDEISLEKNIAGPSTSETFNYEIETSDKIHDLSFVERIKFYPKKIQNKIRKWFMSFNIDINELSGKSATPFAVGRIFFRGDIKKIKMLKEKSKKLDDLLGLKRDEMNLRNINASLPNNGYDEFFLKFKSILLQNKVKINLSTIAKPIWDQKNLKLLIKGKEIKPDKVIWTGNPTGLIKSFGYPLLESLHIKSKDIFIELNDKVKENIYIQIYSSEIPISRIFLYNLKNKGKMTIETLTSEINKNDIIEFTKKIMKSFNYNYKIKEDTLISNDQKKYILISKKDDQLIRKFIHETEGSNLIHGNWLEHGRDQKINFLINSLN